MKKPIETPANAKAVWEALAETPPLDAPTQKALREAIDADAVSGATYLTDFSPDLTGATSSSQAIQDAVDATPVNGTLIFPVGATLLCKNIRLKSDMRVVAYGCKFVFGGTNPAGYSANPDNPQDGVFHGWGTYLAPIKNIRISGGTYKGPRPAGNWTTFSQEDGFQFSWVDRLIIEDCTLHDWAQDGIEIKSCSNTKIRHNYLYDISDAAIEARGGSDIEIYGNQALRTRNLVMYKDHIDDANGATRNVGVRYDIHRNTGKTFGTAFLLNWPNFSRVHHNSVSPIAVTGEDGFGRVQLDIGPHPVTGGPPTMESLHVSDNTFTGATAATVMRIVGVMPAVCHDMVFERNTMDGGTYRGIEFVASGRISKNTVKGSPALAISVQAFKDVAVDGNTVSSRISLGVNASAPGTPFIQARNNRSTFDIHAISVGVAYLIAGNVATSIVLTEGVMADVIKNFLNGIIVTGGAGCRVLQNTIVRTGTTTAIRINAPNCQVIGNKISGTGGNLPEIRLNSPAHNCLVADNEIVTTSTGVSIMVEGNKSRITGNQTDGGNQGCRVSGSYNVLIGNYFKNTNFQGLDILATADSTTAGLNTVESAGSIAFSNAGTNTVLSDNRTI